MDSLIQRTVFIVIALMAMVNYHVSTATPTPGPSCWNAPTA